MTNVKRGLKVVIVWLVPLLLHGGFLPGGVSAEGLKVSGTGGSIGGIRLLAEAFRKANPGVEVVVPKSMGSSGGIRAALAGKLDIGISARPLNAEERSRGGREIPYARTAFVFAVNPGVKETGITLPMAVEIYDGKILRWRNGTPLRLVLRPAADSDTETLRRMSPRMAEAVERALGREGLPLAMTDQDCADAIERTPGAFGTMTLSLVVSEKKTIKVLSLSGVKPSNRTVRDGSYPYAKTFYLVTGPNPSPIAERFIRFAVSPEGGAFLERVGHVPLS